MNARERMKNYRCSFGLTIEEMAQCCGISGALLAMIEDGDVTHPNIVHKIQKVYNLSDLEAEELLPENRRPHGGKYDPDKYVLPIEQDISIIPSAYTA